MSFERSRETVSDTLRVKGTKIVTKAFEIKSALNKQGAVSLRIPDDSRAPTIINSEYITLGAAPEKASSLTSGIGALIAKLFKRG